MPHSQVPQKILSTEGCLQPVQHLPWRKTRVAQYHVHHEHYFCEDILVPFLLFFSSSWKLFPICYPFWVASRTSFNISCSACLLVKHFLGSLYQTYLIYILFLKYISVGCRILGRQFLFVLVFVFVSFQHTR